MPPGVVLNTPPRAGAGGGGGQVRRDAGEVAAGAGGPERAHPLVELDEVEPALVVCPAQPVLHLGTLRVRYAQVVGTRARCRLRHPSDDGTSLDLCVAMHILCGRGSGTWARAPAGASASGRHVRRLWISLGVLLASWCSRSSSASRRRRWPCCPMPATCSPTSWASGWPWPRSPRRAARARRTGARSGSTAPRCWPRSPTPPCCAASRSGWWSRPSAGSPHRPRSPGCRCCSPRPPGSPRTSWSSCCCARVRRRA